MCVKREARLNVPYSLNKWFSERKVRLSIQYQNKLNSAQLEAVVSTDGPLLVIAGAGSGKTRTLTYRVAHLVESGVSPEAILLLTFTRKAAEEMLKRAERLLDQRCQNVSGGTFHSFSNGVLRKYGSKMGIQERFTILDRNDSEALISDIRKGMRLTESAGTFPRKRTILQIFSKAANKSIQLDEVIEADFSQFFNHTEALAALHQQYVIRKRKNGLLDYDDLLLFTNRLLLEFREIRERISSTYRYIMVDEYQDTNKIQADILYGLTECHQNIMAVGDDAQSIYAFRGANFQNIMDFPKKFPGVNVIRLEENYRSTQPILGVANDIMSNAQSRYEKILFSRITSGSTPRLVVASGEKSQSIFVASKIEDLLLQGVELNQIAVLFRAGFHSFDLEIELNRHNIPFVKVGGFRFTESSHVKDFLAHLRILANPYDQISWYRILLLVDRVGQKTAGDIWKHIFEQKSGFTGLFSLDARTKRFKGLDALKALYQDVGEGSQSLSEIGAAVFKYYEPIMQKRYDDHPKRTREIEQVMEMMENCDSLDHFLCDMALEPPTTSMSNELFSENTPGNYLTLSTIHSAKGLEWHTVFIIWVLDGRFPSLYSIYREDELEEELRLLYVAATRAKENLFFTYPTNIYDKASGRILYRPSRFLDQISPDSLRKQAV